MSRVLRCWARSRFGLIVLRVLHCSRAHRPGFRGHFARRPSTLNTPTPPPNGQVSSSPVVPLTNPCRRAPLGAKAPTIQPAPVSLPQEGHGARPRRSAWSVRDHRPDRRGRDGGGVSGIAHIMGAVGRGRGRRTGLALTFRRPLMFPSDSRSRTSSRSTADRSGVWATARTFAPNVHRPLMSCPNLTRGGLQP